MKTYILENKGYRTTCLVLIFSFLILKNGLFAQNSAVTNAILYQREGDLAKAKEQIDQAAEHDKTKDKAKTWYYKASIYQSIYKSDDVKVKELAIDALISSSNAFFKAIALEQNANGEYTQLSNNALQENWVNLINRGSAYYQTKKYQDALDMYEMAQKISPKDTTAYIYGAYAAEGAQKEELLQKYSNKLLEMNYKSLYIYSNTIRYSMEQKQYEKVIKQCNEALQSFPLEKNILQFRTLAYIESGKVEEGIGVLKAEMKTKPYDIQLNTNLAVLYNERKDLVQALAIYNRIIAVEPYNFFANYNAAVINLNNGNELAKKNDKAGSQALFKKALENAKRAKTLASEDDDIDTMKKLIVELDSLLGNE